MMCEVLREQLGLLQQDALSRATEISRCRAELEAVRREVVKRDVDLAAARQRLRQLTAAAGTAGAAPGAKGHSAASQGRNSWGSEGGCSSVVEGGAKDGCANPAPGPLRPLSMAGWEDLLDQASADLEQLEGQVSAASMRLMELQAEQGILTEAVRVLAERRAQAEQVENTAHVALRVSVWGKCSWSLGLGLRWGGRANQ